VDHDLIEKLRADKRELQEKVDILTEDLQNYKRLLKENGFDDEEDEVCNNSEIVIHFLSI
jgi:predicted ribosome quality control (RQC) complex YloA/Tae2 family protein